MAYLRPLGDDQWRALRATLRRGGTLFLRFGRFLVIALVSIYAAYLVLGNIFIRSKMLAHLVSRDPDAALLDYAAAYTYFPGRVWVEGFSLRVTDQNLQFLLTVERATAHIDLAALFHKSFHAYEVEAVNTRYRMRMRRSVEDALHDLPALPPVDGLDELPLFLIQPPDPPPPDDPFPYWSARIDHAVTTAPEIWIDTIRFQGRAKLEGSFDFKPLRHFELGPIAGTFENAHLSYAGKNFIDAMDGRFSVAAPMFSTREPPEREFITHFDIAVAAKGTTSAAHVFHAFDLHPGGVHVEDGSGQFDIVAGLQRAVILPGSRLFVESDHAGIEKGAITGTIGHTWVRLDARKDAVDLRTGVSSLDVKPHAAELAPLHAEEMEAELSLHVKDIVHAPSIDRAHVTLPRAEGSLRWLDGLTEKVHFEAGAMSARVDMTLDGSDHATGEAAVLVKGAQVSASGMHIAGDVDARAGDLSGGFESPHLRVGRATIALTNASLGTKTNHIEGYGARLDFDGITLLHEHDGLMLGTRIRGWFRDATPATIVLQDKDLLPGWVAHAIDFRPLTTSVHVSKTPHLLDLDVLEARGSGNLFEGRMLLGDRESHGAFRVKVGVLSAGIRIDDGKTDLSVLAGEGWMKERRSDLRLFAIRMAGPPEAAPITPTDVKR